MAVHPQTHVQSDELPAPERGNVIRTAVCQYAPVLGDFAANVEKSEAAIQEAAAGGADLIVLPEMANSGYVVHSRRGSAALSPRIRSREPGGTTLAGARQRA